MRKYFTCLLAAIVVFAKAEAQLPTAPVTVTSSDSLSCTVPSTVLTAHVIGDTPIVAGITTDDYFNATTDPIGFTFNFYGNPYTSCLIGPNGNICFDVALAGLFSNWMITGPLLGNSTVLNSICAPWCDILEPAGGSITYSTSGVAPNRIFAVNYCHDAMFSCTAQFTTSQILMYESTNVIDVFIAHKTICAGWNGGYAIIGVQNAAGTAATAAPGRDYPAMYTCVDEGWRFTPNATSSAYSVASIPYAPIPYESSPVYWYNTNTGAYLGSGVTLTVNPTVATTYSAAVLGCTDTSFGYYKVTPPDSIFITSEALVNPTLCGIGNGSITLSGLYPSTPFIISYKYDGVLQTPVSITSDASGNIVLNGLFSGIYDSIVATLGICITPAVGPFTLTGPPPPVLHIISSTNPTQCGFCDGTILAGTIAPFATDSVFISRNDTALPGIINVSEPDGTVFLPGLCAGTYTLDSIKVGPCASPVTGLANLVAPPLTAGFTDTIHYGCNGDTVFFYNASTSTGPLYYIWEFGDGYSDTATNPKHIYQQGIYTATLYADNHVCTDSFKVQDSLIHYLHASFIDSPSIQCQDSLVMLTNTTSDTADVITGYEWLFGDGTTSTAYNPTHVYKNSGVYKLQLVATDFIPCHDTATILLPIDSTTAIHMALTDSVICKSSAVTFTGSFTNIGSTGYTWDFGDGDSVKNVNPVLHGYDGVGTYTVTLRTYYRSCRDTSATHTFTIFAPPTLNLGGDLSICPGSNALVLTDSVNIGDTLAHWLWSTGQTGPTIAISQPGSYALTVTINGCRSTDSIFVKNDCYMNIPNVFTPNGDGVNDYFFPRSLLTSGLTQFSMNIYNRWGELIFQTSSLTGEGWDGKFNNIPQPEGVYVYLIDAQFKDGQREHHQGNITLLR